MIITDLEIRWCRHTVDALEHPFFSQARDLWRAVNSAQPA